MKQKVNSFDGKYSLVLITFLFYLFIASQIPYMLDDWNWGIDAGIKSFITADQNSRYSGNLVVLILTRSTLLKSVVMAAVFTFLPYMMVRIVGVDNVKDFVVKFLLCNLLIFCMPSRLWRQTYGWVSGFANFVVSALFLCGHILLLKSFVFCEVKDRSSGCNGAKAFLFFVFGFVGQLFIENLTIYFLAAYLAAIIYSIAKKDIPHPYMLAVSLGIFLGCLVMFSSNLYDTLLSTGTAYGGYRELMVDTDSGLWDMVRSIIHNFRYQSAQQVTIEFYPQTVLILICMTALLILKKNRFSLLLALGNIGMGMIYAIVWGVGAFVPYRYKILFGLFYFLVILVEYVYIFKFRSAEWIPMAFVWLSVYGVVLPLAVTNFAGGRLLLAPYILVNIFVLNLISEVLHRFPIRRIITVCTCIATLLFSVHYAQIYISIGTTNRARLDTISEAIEQDAGVICLEAYEHLEYMWGQDPIATTHPIDLKWLWDYKTFYGIPSNYILYITERQ